MGRHVSMERRRELALLAFEAIRTRGLYGITMSELAGLLGLKRSTAYWYFRDLGHVFEIVLEHVLERQRAFLIGRMQALGWGAGRAPQTSGPPHPIDALYAYVEGIWDFFSAEGPYLLQLVSFWG
ncbi:MAG TPA: TetR/AcrR family transcriptional regulator, partial [Myxococcota bacterium]|nr:TetR/AcrR family transcriptional regulator [Myxococcota bacterium]